MIKQCALVLLLLLATAACSVYHKELDKNPSFSPHHFSYYDVEIAWQAERTGQRVSLAGTVTNRRSYYLRDLELTVRLTDERRKILARETYADFPTYIPPGRSEPFRMEFRPSPDFAPTHVRFTYIYWLAEEPPAFTQYRDVPYFGNFESLP